jgi:hypothetical protein
MNKINYVLRKFTLLMLIITLTMVALPVSTASAAGLKADDTPPTTSADRTVRLSLVWERLQRTYDRQGLRLERADAFLDALQTRLDLANKNGKDTSAIQAALDVLSQAIKDANPIHQSAKGIIASHKGFDADGKVTDRLQALETIRSLGRSIQNVRDLVSDPHRLLREALIAFREANTAN